MMHRNNQKATMVIVFWLILFGFANAPTKAESAVETQSSPDRIWSEISDRESVAPKDANRALEYWIWPDKFRTFSLDKAAIDKVLGDAPQEVLGLPVKSRPQPALIYLPTPDGQYMAFKFVESPIMAPGLAEQFPEIKTYAGTSVDDSSVKLRFDFTPAGFHAQILAPGARWYIDPQFKGDTHRYVSYHSTDYRLDKEFYQCLLESKEAVGASSVFPQRSGDTLRQYRLAVATTGEYSQFHGGTTAGTLAAVTTTINRVTGIYEREVAIRLTLVANNNLIIYTNPGTDPFTGNNNAGVLISESQSVINNVIGAANYDIGHTLSTGAGGLAGLGVVCNNFQKARGVTGSRRPIGDPFDVDYVAHEMGHQFGGNHTFNGANGNCSGGNRHGSTAYEPGSGSTIQAYAGICGADNLQSNSDPIFHSVSHTEIMNYVGGAGACGTTTSLNNAIPKADAGSDYTIPVQTPFVLNGSSSDDDAGDTLTYLWEERDLGSQAALNAADDGQIPLFRVFTPSASPLRFLPRLATLANNNTDNAEKLPQLGRTMDWRLTVRDNEGGVDADDMQVVVDQNSGPFQVTSPNGGEDLSGIINITWNVANTSNAPVGAANLDIFLSTDGGLTFDLTEPLVSRTANDGSHSVALPNITSTTARIMVKGSDNIFFDVSDQDFSISPDDTPVPVMTSPVPGSPLSDSTVTFQWTANGAPVTQWWLYLGSSQGADDLHDSGSLGTNLSTTVSGLPTDGRIIFARLWYRLASVWLQTDVQYTAASKVEPPVITSPVPGSSLADSTVIFEWTANSVPVTQWWLYLGSSQGADDLHDSGSLGTSLSTTVSGLPTDGRIIFARLWYRLASGWKQIDVQYTAGNQRGLPTFISPVAGSPLSGSTATFQWTAKAVPVTEWWLYLGTSRRAKDLHDSGSLGMSLSTTVSGLPTDGSIIFARLWYRLSSDWKVIDAQYVAGNQAGLPAFTSPTPGSPSSGSTVTFRWAANGVSVTEWWLYLGTSQGANDLYNSGSLGTSLATTVKGLPTDGSIIFAQLWYRLASGWEAIEAQYAAGNHGGLPAFTSPVPGSPLSGSTVTFQWTANGVPVTQWWLYLGTSQGARNLYNSGSLGTSLSTTATGLPTDGSIIFARLWYLLASGWKAIDAQYAANSQAGLPALIHPAPGSPTSGSTVTFQWTANGVPVTQWWLYLGTSQGDDDLHDSGSLGTSQSTTVTGLPTDGSIIFARLWYRLASGWKTIDAQYAAGSTGSRIDETESHDP